MHTKSIQMFCVYFNTKKTKSAYCLLGNQISLESLWKKIFIISPFASL